jgi:hypothetical protein
MSVVAFPSPGRRKVKVFESPRIPNFCSVSTVSQPRSLTMLIDVPQDGAGADPPYQSVRLHRLC